MSELNLNYTQQAERDIRRIEANFTNRFHNAKQDTLKQVRDELCQKSL
jgi:F0F1-type ATP synthase membrane subunit b/b'